MKKLFFLCFFSVLILFSGFGQTKRQDIIKLLQLTNTSEQAMHMFDLMLPSFQEIAPDAPESFWRTFRSRIDVDHFVVLLVPIYDRNFSHEDILHLIRFYESPIGRKLLDVTPQITQESFSAGAEWGENLAIEIINELSRDGYF